MASLSTVYMLIDDTDTTGNAGGGAMQIGPDFVAPTAAAATQVAYLIATTLQRNVRVVNKFFPAPPFTKVGPGPANTALTVVPSGVGMA